MHMEAIMEFFEINEAQLFMYIAIIFVILLIIREARCWYWKVNEIVDEQKKQTEILEEILFKINPNAMYFDRYDDENEKSTPI